MSTRRAIRTDVGTAMGGLSEAALQEHLQLIILLDALQDLIYLKDRESRFLRVSRALAARFNLSDPAEAVGKTDFDFFPREFAQRAYECEQQIIKTGKPVLDLEERAVWPDKTETWSLATKMPYRDARGRVIGTFGLTRDITDHKK